jgi:hypothetical protein
VYTIKKAGYSGVFMFEAGRDKENKTLSPQQLVNCYKKIEADCAAYIQQ